MLENAAVDTPAYIKEHVVKILQKTHAEKLSRIKLCQELNTRRYLNALTLVKRWPCVMATTGLSHIFLGMGPGPLELGKIASF